MMASGKKSIGVQIIFSHDLSFLCHYGADAQHTNRSCANRVQIVLKSFPTTLTSSIYVRSLLLVNRNRCSVWIDRSSGLREPWYGVKGKKPSLREPKKQ